MTNEEAIKAIKSHCYFANLVPVGKDALDMVIKALETPPNDNWDGYSSRLWKAAYERGKEDAEQRWIPTSERLPEPGEFVGAVARYYLVQTEYGDMVVARYSHSGYWKQIYQIQPIGDEIVAWMPLPEVYKEESEVLNADSN